MAKGFRTFLKLFLLKNSNCLTIKTELVRRCVKSYLVPINCIDKNHNSVRMSHNLTRVIFIKKSSSIFRATDVKKASKCMWNMAASVKCLWNTYWVWSTPLTTGVLIFLALSTYAGKHTCASLNINFECTISLLRSTADKRKHHLYKKSV